MLHRLSQLSWRMATTRNRALVLAEQLAIECNLISKDFPAYEQDGLGDQLRRAARSAALNLAEGAGRSSYKDYLRFLDTTRGSLKEVGMALNIARGSSYITQEQYDRLEAIRDETARLVYGIIRSTTRRLERGSCAAR